MPASTCGGERNRAWRRSASGISLMDDIGPRRPVALPPESESPATGALVPQQARGFAPVQLPTPLGSVRGFKMRVQRVNAQRLLCPHW